MESPVTPDAWLQLANVICNTIQICFLTWIGANLQRTEMRDR